MQIVIRPVIISALKYPQLLQQNKSLKPTVTRVTPFAEKAKPAPLYGGLVPPLYDLNRSMQLRLYQCCSTLTKI
jgi:hypothetical protein